MSRKRKKKISGNNINNDLMLNPSKLGHVSGNDKENIIQRKPSQSYHSNQLDPPNHPNKACHLNQDNQPCQDTQLYHYSQPSYPNILNCQSGNEKDLVLLTIWKIGCFLYNLLKINLEVYPRGNVITKKSVQRRRLACGYMKEYTYFYDNVDEYGVGQHHLPVKNKGERKNPNDERWIVRDKIMYRKRIENQIKISNEMLENLIKQYNSLKKCYEVEKTVESVMKDIEKAIQNKASVESEQFIVECYEGLAKYKNDCQIITEMGENVRSKNECLFANLLTEMRIPYLYEAWHKSQLLPDFTIFIGDRIYYIEILGKMNEADYRERQCDKLEQYAKAGVKLGENLIFIDVTLGIDLPRLRELMKTVIAEKVPKSIFYGYDSRKVA